MVVGTPLRILPMALAISMAACIKAMVPLMMKTAFNTPSSMALPIPKVKTPKRIFPTTLPEVTAIN